MTNSERQARWLAKNRVIFNLRRRNARKKDLSGGVESRHAPVGRDSRCVETSLVSNDTKRNGTVEIEIPAETSSSPIAHRPKISDSGSSAPPAQKSKVEELRELMKRASEAKPDREVAARPVIFRDDYGRVITERQWKLLEETKASAKARGYEIDEFTQ